jgi:type IV fimbrial biogenesis protein FimT
MPGFGEFYTKNRITAQSNDFNTVISLARNEAIKRGRPVCVVRTSTNWEAGFRIFVDKSASMNLTNNTDACKTDSSGCQETDTTSGCNIQVYPALTGGSTLRTSSGESDGPYQQWLRFNPMGVAVDKSNNGASGSFRLCRSDQNASKSNLITISVTGYPVSKPNSGSCP